MSDKETAAEKKAERDADDPLPHGVMEPLHPTGGDRHSTGEGQLQTGNHAPPMAEDGMPLANARGEAILGTGFDSEDRPELPFGGSAVEDGVGPDEKGVDLLFGGISGWRGQHPAFHTVIVPEDPSGPKGDPEDYNGLHTFGRTYTFARGVPKRIAPADAKWLLGHPTLQFSKAK